MQIDELIELALEPRKPTIHLGEARVHFRVEPLVREIGVLPLFDKRGVHLVEPLVHLVEPFIHLVEPLIHLVEPLIHRRGQLAHLLLDHLNTPGNVIKPVRHASACPRVYHRPGSLRRVGAAQAHAGANGISTVRAGTKHERIRRISPPMRGGRRICAREPGPDRDF